MRLNILSKHSNSGFWSRNSRVNIIISSIHQALYIVSQPWQTEPYVAHTLCRRTSSLAAWLLSLLSICQALSVFSIWKWEQANTVVPPLGLWQHGISTQAEHKPCSHTSQQHCVRFSLAHHVIGTAGMGGSWSPLLSSSFLMRSCPVWQYWQSVCCLGFVLMFVHQSGVCNEYNHYYSKFW